MERTAASRMTLQQALDLAVEHHQAGRLRDAEKVYQQILSGDPNNPHALHLLGVLFSQVGRHSEAVDYIRRAIAQNPTAAQYQYNLGAAFVSAGRNEEAVETYTRALVLQPDVPDAYLNLGIALLRLGRIPAAIEALETAYKSRPNDFKTLDSLGSALSQGNRNEEAVAILRKALAQRSDYAPTHHTLGNALLRLDRVDDAAAEYRAALALRPDFPDAMQTLAGLCVDKGAFDEAIELARKTLKLQPNSVVAWYHLGRALHKLNRLEEALDAEQHALAIDPNFYFAHNEKGNVLLDMGRHDESIASFHRLLELAPSGQGRYNLGSALWQAGRPEEAIQEFKAAQSQGFIDPRLFNNLGAVHHQLGRFDQAADYFRQAMQVGDGFPLARFNLAMLQLLQGDFKNGWHGYESRWIAKSLARPPRYAQFGTWDGSSLNGRRILVDCEQGFGDSIQFARFIPLLAQGGGKPIVATQVELRRLLTTLPGLEGICAPPEDIPSFDVQCPIMSLAFLLDITLQTIPAKVPYLFADQKLTEAWSKRMPSDRLKVGLCWAGSPMHLEDRMRSLAPADLKPLERVDGAWFCSLQKSPDGRPAALPESPHVTDWTSELRDFADTAALIANLDIVITCDTSVAHLAGALGKPIWLLIPRVPDWRWLLERNDSPWYPTMKVFRQSGSGDWGSVVEQVRHELAKSPELAR